MARNADQLKAKQEELSKLGECEIISADLKNIAGIKQLVSQFAEKESRLDILVNNAGISDGGKALDDVTESDWNRVMDLNIKSIYFLIQAFLPYFRVNCSPETPKKVINIPLINGTLGIFLSRNHIIANDTIVATIKGGIAIFKSFPLS